MKIEVFGLRFFIANIDGIVIYIGEDPLFSIFVTHTPFSAPARDFRDRSMNIEVIDY